MLKFYKIILSIFITGIAIVGYMFSADAANQGILETTSTASFSLGATIVQNGTFNNLSKNDTFCVYSIQELMI